MVHILKHVLSKIHFALRTGGELLIIQPASQNTTIILKIQNQICFKEELVETNFQEYLLLTDTAVRNSIKSKQFELIDEAVCPEDKMVFVSEYNSIKDYVEVHLPFCEDVEAFNLLVSKMKRTAITRTHLVQEYWKEHRLLLRKLN